MYKQGGGGAEGVNTSARHMTKCNLDLRKGSTEGEMGMEAMTGIQYTHAPTAVVACVCLPKIVTHTQLSVIGLQGWTLAAVSLPILIYDGLADLHTYTGHSKIYGHAIT